jgi:hypothetical protein
LARFSEHALNIQGTLAQFSEHALNIQGTLARFSEHALNIQGTLAQFIQHALNIQGTLAQVLAVREDTASVLTVAPAVGLREFFFNKVEGQYYHDPRLYVSTSRTPERTPTAQVGQTGLLSSSSSSLRSPTV